MFSLPNRVWERWSWELHFPCTPPLTGNEFPGSAFPNSVWEREEMGSPPMKYRRIIVNRRRQLELVEDDLPKPGPGEVRVKILAAGISFADLSMREGVHPEARRPPFTPGWDVVGVIDLLGEKVEALPLRTVVAAMPIVGGYAE